MRGDGMEREPPMETPDRELWRRSLMINVIEDDAARYLDLAGLADEFLDPDDRERIAEQLARDPDAAADIAAARSLAAAARHETPPATVVARARSLVDGDPAQAAEVIPFEPRRRARPASSALAQWGSLAAAVVVAGWLGFALGMDTFGRLTQNGGGGDENFLAELLDPAPGLLRDLTEGPRT